MPAFLDALRERGIALALDRPGLDAGSKTIILAHRPDHRGFYLCAVAGRSQGHRGKTKIWNRIIEDRSADLRDWAEVLKTVSERKIEILAFANNHYAGFGPGTLEEFRRLWGGKARDTSERQKDLFS